MVRQAGAREVHGRISCYTGDYLTELVDIEELISARQKRK